jgi:uncharacterized protein YjiS (DUF1127 family)
MTQTLNNFFKKLINSYKYNREVNATIKELQKLTNAELNDIGLSRGDIWHVAHESHINKNLRGWV